VVAAFLLGAITCDALGDPDAVGRAVEHALDLAEAGKMLFPFLIQPAPGLLDHQARYRAAPAALISEAVDLLARVSGPAPPGEPMRPCEPLTQGETRVLRYLPSNLSAREIAHELYLSMNTVKTHQRHLYRKLDARTRTQAVERARALGLLAPPSRRP
jgi:LuxR family maltose regulon positive regulatory protein